jgi:hypothetical protein
MTRQHGKGDAACSTGDEALDLLTVHAAAEAVAACKRHLVEAGRDTTA